MYLKSVNNIESYKRSKKMFLWTNLTLQKSEQIRFDNTLYIQLSTQDEKKFDCKLYVYQTMILYKLLNVD